MDINKIFTHERIQQSFIQFACRTATHQPFSPKQNEDLKDSLKGKYPELFQRFENNPAIGIQAFCDHILGPIAVPVPSLLIDNVAVTIIRPVQINQNKLNLADPFSIPERNRLNEEMSKVLMDIQQITNIGYQRAGKIFEFNLMCDATYKRKLNKIFSYDLSNTSEINISLTNQVTVDSFEFNKLTVMGFSQLKLDQQFLLRVRIDINNRQLMRSMEPFDIKNVWNNADAMIENYLNDLLEF